MLHGRLNKIHTTLNTEIIIRFSGIGINEAYIIEENGNPFVYEISVNDKTCKSYIYLDVTIFQPQDIILIKPNGTYLVLFKVNSNDNVLFITDQCDNRCLMCCQPPKKIDDLEYFYHLNSILIQLLPKDIKQIGITGGEPTLLEDKLIALVHQINVILPDCVVHLLSNGRRFANLRYVQKLAKTNIQNLIIGIPLHSDFSNDHELITQVTGSYIETITGVYNLARLNFAIEIRVVINAVNYRRLFEMSEFIFRNLSFASHVAFMGMEYRGLALKNSREVWIESNDFNPYLEKAVINLARYKMNVSVFNIPLCVLNENLHEFAKQSISDWKVSFKEECFHCVAKNECCGIFSTSMIKQYNINPICN